MGNEIVNAKGAERLCENSRADLNDGMISAFSDMLCLAELGFRALPGAIGRPGFDPGVMLRIYLYDYLNQVQ